MEKQALDQPRVGKLEAGPLDSICDVGDITVGHCTLADGALQTGVTVLRPHGGDLYLDKVPAAATVLNGFGKSTGLVQVQELGVLETPVALTNTFGVGTVANAQIRAAIAANPEIGRGMATVNPLVFECNDGYLNDIQAMAVQESHYTDALAAADKRMAQGAVGAGRGMSCFSFKGGIGSASRVAPIQPGLRYTVGALVLANFGRLPNLTVAGRPFGRRLADQLDRGLAQAGENAAIVPEKGSIILLVATDAPLDARQLRRVATRTGAGLARTGSVYGHGSGDVALAFTTGYTVPHDAMGRVAPAALVPDPLLDPIFQATADATEQAILHALFAAESVLGRDGHVRRALADVLPDWATL